MKIIAVGKIRKKFVEDGIKYFQKQLTKLEIIEVKQSNIEQEGLALISKIRLRDYVIILDISGQTFSSLEFAKKLDEIKTINSEIVFVIGGSVGSSEEVKARANLAISFSKMTFPHELFRLMLVEQIYRAESILNGKPYHK